MQKTTVDLWVLLCAELESRKAKDSATEHSAAAKKFEEAAKQVFQNHPARLRDALEISGDVHQSAEAMEDARRCFEEAFALPDSSAEQRVRLATKLALLCESQGDEHAIEYYEHAIAAHADPSMNRAGLPTLLNNLGGLHRARGDKLAAERAYRRALDEAVAAHGPHHPEVALLSSNLGVALTDCGDLVKAEELHLRALEIREQAYGSNHPDVGQSLANLAVVYHARGLNEKAERFYRSAIQTLAQFYGPDHEQVRWIQANCDRLPQVHARMLSKTRKL